MLKICVEKQTDKQQNENVPVLPPFRRTVGHELRKPKAKLPEGAEGHPRGSVAAARPALRRTVTAVLIANEENGTVENIGVDQLMASGKMDGIRGGPVIWVDCADSQPCIGTAGSITWHLKATGKLFHSGLPPERTILHPVRIRFCHQRACLPPGNDHPGLRPAISRL